MTLQDSVYLRRLTAIFAGLNQGGISFLENKTVRKIRNMVAAKMSKADEGLLPDEAWAAQVGNDLLRKFIVGVIDTTQLMDLLLLQYHKRLEYRKLTNYSVLMGFYDFAYIVSIAYMVMGSSKDDLNEVYIFVRDLKRALLTELDLFILELQPKITGKRE